MITKETFPAFLAAKEYKQVWNCVRLLKLFTINITSIALMEILLHNKEVLQLMFALAVKPQKVSWFTMTTTDRQHAIKAAGELIQFWADFTMVYQGEFPALYQIYHELRQTIK